MQKSRGQRVPSLITLNSAILAMGAKWRMALWLKEGMAADEQTFNAALLCSGRAGQWPHAVALSSEMMALLLVPDERSCDACFGACRRASRAAVAREYLHQVQDAGAALLRVARKGRVDGWGGAVDRSRGTSSPQGGRKSAKPAEATSSRKGRGRHLASGA